MSDNSWSGDSASADNTNSLSNGSSRGLVSWLIVLNGVVCSALVVVWLVFGFPKRDSSNPDNLGTIGNNGEDPPPIAIATDTVEEEDPGDGRPKVIKIKLTWPETGVADFELTERNGKTIQKADLIGHPWVVSFIFTNCAGPCFKVTSAMRKLQDEFLNDTDLRLVTLTVDPERDQPEVLTKYADGFQANKERWLFLTDPTQSKDKIYPLINRSFLMVAQEATGEDRKPGFEFIHTNNVLLVDEHGVVQGKWLSTDEAEFDQLRRELKKRLRNKK